MECPHCFLEMQSNLSNNEVSKCPKCEGLWLPAEIIGNIYGLSTINYDLSNENEPSKNISKNVQFNKNYYYYKKLFTKSNIPDDVAGFD